MTSGVIDRIKFIEELFTEAGDLLVVTGIGTPGSNVRNIADRGLNFYLSGAMGAAAGVGLGLALARPDRRVAVITGDAEMMMNVGTLATIAVQQAEEFSRSLSSTTSASARPARRRAIRPMASISPGSRGVPALRM